MKNIGLLVFFIAAAVIRAESVPLGTHGSLQIAVPEGWQLTSKNVGEVGCNLSLTPKGGANAECLISIMFPPAPKPIDKAKIENDLTAACGRFVSGSVEQKINLKDLGLSEGYGLCATLTDASLVGKPPMPKNYKVMTIGLIQFSEDIMAVVSVFTDDEHGTEQKQLLSMVSGLKVERAK